MKIVFRVAVGPMLELPKRAYGSYSHTFRRQEVEGRRLSRNCCWPLASAPPRPC